MIVPPHIVAQHTREVEEWKDRKKTGNMITNHVAVVVCTVRVTVCGQHKDGQGAGTAEAPIDSYANALETAGFSNVINILHGFEGDLDDKFHRSSLNGWRHDGLPWEQM